MLNWRAIEDLAAREAALRTITRKVFHVTDATDTAVTVRVTGGREYQISRDHLEQAVIFVRQGGIINGPGDFKTKIADDRPAYAWAILHHLGYL